MNSSDPDVCTAVWRAISKPGVFAWAAPRSAAARAARNWKGSVLGSLSKEGAGGMDIDFGAGAKAIDFSAGAMDLAIGKFFGGELTSSLTSVFGGGSIKM